MGGLGREMQAREPVLTDQGAGAANSDTPQREKRKGIGEWGEKSTQHSERKERRTDVEEGGQDAKRGLRIL